MTNHIKEIIKKLDWSEVKFTDQEVSDYINDANRYCMANALYPICQGSPISNDHNWNLSTDECIWCGITRVALLNGPLAPAITWTSTSSSSCCPNGSPNNIKWSGANSQWVCTSCGAAKSNDPNYLYTPRQDEFQKATIKGTGCECGSSAVGSDRHSDWCNLSGVKK